MYRIRKLLTLPGLVFLGGLLLVLRYILKTPQPLASLLPGAARIYKWTHGHIFYKVHGNVDAPSLLLLHAPGIGASAHEMLPIMESLSQHYRVYAPDLPGFGLSDAPDIDYTADIFVAFCRDFLRDVVQQPATLLARGLSCNYALAVASRSPELCTQLVLLSPLTLSGHLPHYPWLSRMISRSTLFSTFVYALLTPRIILRQIIRLQLNERAISREDINYSFAVAHQLGAQYAALAFITGKLNLDARLDTTSQPKLLLWNSAPRINSVTQHTMSLPHVQAIFLNDARYRIHESAPQNVAATILRWQETIHKEVPVTVGTKTAPGDNATIMTSRSLPTVSPLEAENLIAEEVENSQPPDPKTVAESTPAVATVEAFCVKCKQKRTMHHAHRIVTKNGRNALEGICPICNTRLFRFVSG